MRHTNAGPAPLFSALSGLLSYLPYIDVYFLFYFFFGQLVRPLPFVSGTGSVVILAVLCLVSLAGSWFLSSWCEGEFPVMLPFVLYAALIYWQDAPFLLICSALSFIFFLGPTARRMLLLWRRTKTYSYRYEQQMERLQTGFAWRFRLLCLALMAFLFVRVQLVPAAAQTTADQPPAQVFYQGVSFESLFSAYRDELGAFAPAVWGSASRSARRQACEAAVAVCCLYLGLETSSPPSRSRRWTLPLQLPLMEKPSASTSGTYTTASILFMCSTAAPMKSFTFTSGRRRPFWPACLSPRRTGAFCPCGAWAVIWTSWQTTSPAPQMVMTSRPWSRTRSASPPP